MLVYLQQWLKNQPWFPWISHESAQANRIAATVLSGLAVIGIHESHTGSAMTGGTITIVMPPLTIIIAGLWHWIQQYVLTKTAYVALQTQIKPQPTAVIPVIAKPDVK